ncbi:MAG: hypothetical protein ACJ8DI_29870 [Ktedonobacteraceae bacterium]
MMFVIDLHQASTVPHKVLVKASTQIGGVPQVVVSVVVFLVCMNEVEHFIPLECKEGTHVVVGTLTLLAEDAEGLALVVVLRVLDFQFREDRALRIHDAASGLTVNALPHVAPDLSLFSKLLLVSSGVSDRPAAMFAGAMGARAEPLLTSGTGAGEPATLDEMDFVFNGGVAFRLHLREHLSGVLMDDAVTTIKLLLGDGCGSGHDVISFL